MSSVAKCRKKRGKNKADGAFARLILKIKSLICPKKPFDTPPKEIRTALLKYISPETKILSEQKVLFPLLSKG